MRISLGADHRGFKYKEKIKKLLTARNIKTTDFGTSSGESADFADHGISAAEAVAKKDVDYGIIICGTGNGMAIAANKVKGVRAGLANNAEMARLTRAHNDANILTMGDRVLGVGLALEILDLFLKTEFEGGRHKARIDQFDNQGASA